MKYETGDILMFCNTLNAKTGSYRKDGEKGIAYLLEYSQRLIMALLEETGRLAD